MNGPAREPSADDPEPVKADDKTGSQRNDATGQGDEDLERLDYLQLTRDLADRCDAETRLRIRSAMGVKAPRLVTELGTAMSVGERAATCCWGCAGGDHVIEHLLGACIGTTHAGLRLAYLGYYDEAISLARHVAERANLLYLFCIDGHSLNEWRASDSEYRRKNYSAIRVRLRIEGSGKNVPTPEDHYKTLSSYGAHPGRIPQSHNPRNRPTLGGFFEPSGFFVALNEIARSMILSSAFSAPLLEGTAVPVNRLVDTALSAAEYLGGVNTMSIEGFFEQLGAGDSP